MSTSCNRDKGDSDNYALDEAGEHSVVVQQAQKENPSFILSLKVHEKHRTWIPLNCTSAGAKTTVTPVEGLAGRVEVVSNTYLFI